MTILLLAVIAVSMVCLVYEIRRLCVWLRRINNGLQGRKQVPIIEDKPMGDPSNNFILRTPEDIEKEKDKEIYEQMYGVR